MQGQRGAMGSLPDTLDIDRASSSGSTAMSHQLCWNNPRSHPETHLASLILPPPTDGLIHSQQNCPACSSVECSSSSSSHLDNGMPDWKLGNGLPSLAGFSNGLVQPNENRPERANTGDFALSGIGASHLQIQRSNFGWNPTTLSLNGDHNSDNSPTVCPTDQVTDVNGNRRIMQAEVNGGRVGSSSVRLRRVPCKRKSLEGHIGQSFTNPGSHFRQNMPSGESRAVPASFFSVNGVSLPQHAEPRLQQSPVIQVPSTVSGDLPSYIVQGSAEDLGRNSRLRIISSHPMSFSSAVALQNNIPSTSQPSSFTLVNHPADSHSLSGSSVVAAHRPLVVLNAPASAYTRHSSASVFSSSVGSPAHNPASHNPAGSGRNVRNDLGYQAFAMGNGSGPPIQSSTIRSTTDGNGALPGDTVYSSGSRLIPPVPPISQPSHPNMVPLDPIHHSQYLQISSGRFSAEYVRRALLASSGHTAGGESSRASHGHGRPTPARDTMLLSGLVNQDHRQSTERRVDSTVGVPLSRHPASFRGDRRRLAELRNVMETMRRGQGLRLEDIMLLHQSPLLRVADLHDRHRDLRLDVDNMSYEELLALEERIGNVSTGLNEETILSQLKQRKLVTLADRKGDAEPCCICQEEYTSGVDIGTLDCGHEFHTSCIKQWLMHKNSCPICKTTGLAT